MSSLEEDNILYVLKFALQVIEDNDLKDVKDNNNWILGESLEEQISTLKNKNAIVLSGDELEMWNKYHKNFTHKYKEHKKQEIFNKFLKDKKNQLDKDIGVDKWFTEGLHGWKCDKSPIEKCVYTYYDEDSEYGFEDECCFYCGEPEERK